MLGRGSELSRLWAMPPNMGHQGGVSCIALVDDRVYTGGRDSNLFIWRGVQTANGFELVADRQPITLESNVVSLFYDSQSKWLFCGLWSGDIQAYCKEPVMEDRLVGHRRCVSSLVVHSSVLVSGSNDGTIRLWTRNPQSGRYQGYGEALNNPSGAVTAVKVLNDALWVAAQNGITCFDLATMSPKGTISSTHQVTGLVECTGYMLATFRNGDLKVYDAVGAESFTLPSRGEHTSNTAVQMMTHPVGNKPMLLCGQQYGYITAYDLPDFRPRGSWLCKNNSDVRAILDLGMQGMFMTGGVHGDIMVWQWGTPSGAPGSAPAGAPPTASSPFAAGGTHQVVANPFASGAPAMGMGGCAGGCCGGGVCGGGGCGGGCGGCGHEVMMG